ncbi:MAG: TPM domain-containing protein [Chloroflexota bacterium]|nr:TPM domain-containing protein [Chloroflexota bacterium]
MRRLLVALGLALAALGVVGIATVAAEPQIPRPSGYVNDFAGVFTDDVKAPLEDALRLFEQETTVELAVVTMPDLGGTTIEDYAVRLFQEWGIGKKGVNNGVLLLYAQSERWVRIEVGYGMEPYLTDGQAGRILDTDVLPDLRQGNYALGLLKGAKAIAQTIKDSDYQPGSVRPQPTSERVPFPIHGWARLWTLLGIGAATVYVVSYMARTRSVWFGGVWGGLAGGVLGWVAGDILLIVLLVFALGFMGLILDMVLSTGYKYQSSSGRRTDWRHTWGGFSGGWHGGGGGFGGFGGGMSGGGGASRGF